METEVIIVGKGISGLIISKILMDKGISSVILDTNHNDKNITLPKTIPPSTLVLLKKINLLEIFEKTSSKVLGYQSVWGSGSLSNNHFFFQSPFNYGLKINKNKLVESLNDLVNDRIVSCQFLSHVCIQENKVEVELDINKTKRKIIGKVIVDATGRNRGLSRFLDVFTEKYDDLVALTAYLPLKTHPLVKQKVLLESFPYGWGVVSPLNIKYNAMTLYTYKSNSILTKMKDYRSWANILSETKLLKSFLADDFSCKVNGREANTSKLSKLSGQNWLAIGDAAIAFDPLSSHGISNAIYSSDQAANAIDLQINKNDNKSFSMYDKKLNNIFSEFLKHQTELYLKEQRWASYPFWKNAHRAISDKKE